MNIDEERFDKLPERIQQRVKERIAAVDRLRLAEEDLGELL